MVRRPPHASPAASSDASERRFRLDRLAIPLPPMGGRANKDTLMGIPPSPWSGSSTRRLPAAATSRPRWSWLASNPTRACQISLGSRQVPTLSGRSAAGSCSGCATGSTACTTTPPSARRRLGPAAAAAAVSRQPGPPQPLVVGALLLTLPLLACLKALAQHSAALQAPTWRPRRRPPHRVPHRRQAANARARHPSLLLQPPKSSTCRGRLPTRSTPARHHFSMSSRRRCSRGRRTPPGTTLRRSG